MMYDVLLPRRNKSALPRAILTSGLFFTGISASYAALFPVESFPLPGKNTFLYQGDDQLIYAVYHKTAGCPDAVEECSSYAVIENQAVKQSEHWIADSLKGMARFDSGFRFVTYGPNNELYISSTKRIYKLNADPRKDVTAIFTMPEKIGIYNYITDKINTFLFNKDFTRLYTGMALRNSNYNAAAAWSLNSENGEVQPEYLWNDNRGSAEPHAIYSPYNHELIFQSNLSNYSGYSLSSIEGDYQYRAGQWFTSGAAVIDENNMLYGLNAYQCKINKIRLKGASSDQPGWIVSADGCTNSVLWNHHNTHIKLGSEDSNLLYASYENAVYAINRDTGATLFTVPAPEGTKFIHQTTFDTHTGWGYRSFSGENGSGVLAFSPDGQNSKIILHRWGINSAPMIQGHSLYVATSGTLYRYTLDGQEIAGWKQVKQIEQDVLKDNKDDKFISLAWSVKENGIEIERGFIPVSPRDSVDKKISPYQWPLQLATAINERSLYLKAGEQQDDKFTPLASKYRNFIFVPQGSTISVELIPTFYDFADCSSGCNSGVVHYWGINPTGSYICSFKDLAPGSQIKVTATPPFGQVETKIFEAGQNTGRYSWPKFLSDFINNQFGNYAFRAGEKMDAKSDVQMRTIYSGYRNRLWLSGNNRITIELPEGVGKITDDCDEDSMAK